MRGSPHRRFSGPCRSRAGSSSGIRSARRRSAREACPQLRRRKRAQAFPARPQGKPWREPRRRPFGRRGRYCPGRRRENILELTIGCDHRFEELRDFTDDAVAQPACLVDVPLQLLLEFLERRVLQPALWVRLYAVLGAADQCVRDLGEAGSALPRPEFARKLARLPAQGGRFFGGRIEKRGQLFFISETKFITERKKFPKYRRKNPRTFSAGLVIIWRFSKALFRGLHHPGGVWNDGIIRRGRVYILGVFQCFIEQDGRNA